ncbi:RHS repeat protein [Shewanella sp. YLB-07]|uniref:RHS repeat protein n=1 Tax=Shewanella sp. YLB-07 TaxID=2601268 RepID=UPI00128C304A|nr:RHS repeat protein [Shewanella sp. YLB-07]MPY23761.1 RHS repeat protein [Shewanella sp. YLB-07]
MSNITSNAFNFSEFISSGVDPRTGTYSFSINLGVFLSHKTSGPEFSLTLNYSASGTTDSGFGRGWGLALSRFNKSMNILSLSTGQSFQIVWNSEKNEYDMPYRKIKDMRIFYLDATRELKVVYKGGRQDYIDYEDGTLSRSISPQGLAIQFEYGYFNNESVLWRIYDDAGRELIIDWWTNKWQSVLEHRFDNHIYQRVLFDKIGGGSDIRLSSITLPEHTSHIDIEYRYVQSNGFDLIERVTHASGMIEEMTYLDNGHSLPNGAPLSTVPYVTEYRNSPGKNQPALFITYSYSDTNYLGFASDRAWVFGEDTLFKAHQKYQYTSTEIINGSQSILRVYNKYHLLDRAEYRKEGNLYLKEENEYFANLDIGIEYQPATYSFVKEHKNIYYQDGASKAYTISYNYDDYGNQTYIKQVDGTEIIRAFYPAFGEGDNCPAEPNAMVALLKRESFLPACTTHGETPRHVDMTYMSLPTLNHSNEYFVVLKRQISQDNSVQLDYYRHRDNRYEYGRLYTQSTTVNGQTSSISYRYDFAGSRLTTTQGIIAHDGLTASTSDTITCLDGQSIEYVNAENIKMVSTYDDIGRKLTSTVAPETEYVASVKYHYEVGSGINALTTTDAKGNRQVQHFNNAGKNIKAQQTDKNGVLRNISEHHYDAFGLFVTQTDIDWLGDTPLSLTTGYKYDDHGNINKVTHPDGRVESIIQNRVTLTTNYDIVGLLKEVTVYNESGLEISKETLDADNNQLAKTSYHYDGYANLLETADTNNHLTKQGYDSNDRVIIVDREIDNQTVTQTLQYANFSTDELPTDIKMNDISLGQRQYDGFSRMVQEESGTMMRRFHYTGPSMMPSEQETPHGDTVTFDHNKYLQVPLSMNITGSSDLASIYGYDKVTGSLKQTLNQSGLQGFDYNRLGQLVSESVQLNDGTERTAYYDYSLMGLLLSKEDYFGHVTVYRYDRYSRLETVVSTESGQSTTTNLSYDDYSRPRQYDTSNGDDTVSITLVLNAMGMEARRIVTVNGVEEFSITQTFNTDLQIKEKIYQEGTEITTEIMTYDELHRLDAYTCSGPNAPQDEYGHVITAQSFQYDVYGNITQANSTFINGASNTSIFTYAVDNPVQLKSMTNTHESYTASVSFDYDAAGNLLSDEQGREYQYNSLDQMETVSQDGQTLSQYHYDAIGQVVSQTNDENLIYLYYQGKQLANEFSEAVHTCYQRVGGAAVSRTVNAQGNAQHQFLIPNAQGSILTTLAETETSDARTKQTRQYTPYGEG